MNTRFSYANTSAANAIPANDGQIRSRGRLYVRFAILAPPIHIKFFHMLNSVDRFAINGPASADNTESSDDGTLRKRMANGAQ
jgi:hypothetical protein